MPKYWFVFIGVWIHLVGSYCAATEELHVLPVTRQHPPGWEWTNEKWMGNDRPYRDLRRSIEQAVKRTNQRDVAVLVEKYRKRAVAHPVDPKAQFAWGYATLEGRRKGYTINRDVARRVSLALTDATSPKTYQYARLRFLMTMHWGTYPQLKSLGQRLLLREPRDNEVKYYVVRLLSSGSGKEKQQAMNYAQELVRLQPKWSGSYSALGEVYREIFFTNKDLAAGDKAIAAFRKSIQLMPPDSNHENTDYLIKIIRKWQVRWKRKDG
ncbi:MAG TPA: hypothetical protein VF600_00960 [Abditibacteriaceae bacterium]|jgi:tetratricopeptide (TPR) repeat protein